MNRNFLHGWYMELKNEYANSVSIASNVLFEFIVMYLCDISSGHIWMWELDYKPEHRRMGAFELWCWRRLLRVPWTARRSNQSILKEISTGCSLEGLIEAETPILWPPNAKSWCSSFEKSLMLGKIEGEKKGMTEDEMVGWHHWLDRHDFEQAPGVGDGQGSLLCCSPWGCKELDMTEWLNWTQFHHFRIPGCDSLCIISFSFFFYTFFVWKLYTG